MSCARIRRPIFTLIALAVLVANRAAGDDAGFKPIFNGKSLDGWDGNPDFWRVEGGAIIGQTTREKPTQGNTFLIWRQGEVDDFELLLEYRITGGNSGIQYRSYEKPEEWGKWVAGGYQADIDATNRFTGILYSERERGILAERGQKVVIGADGKPKPAGSAGDAAELLGKLKKEDWNEYRIIASGNHLVHAINGSVFIDAVDEDTARRRRGGILALQLHQGPPMKIEMRSIRLKRLKMEDRKKIVLIAGRPSHGPGDHEHNAGCRLLAGCIQESLPSMFASVYLNGWPSDPTALDNADSILLYSDGGRGHMVLPHLEEVDALMKKGVGLACIHYAVEPADEKYEKPTGRKEFLDWIGGYFETNWSVNPHWTADFKTLPDHPITRGVKPFKVNDEWYFYMRFRPEMKGVTPILSAVATPDTMSRPDGTHSGNPTVRESVKRGESQTLAWAMQREGGGRGFGLTGAHYHKSWGDENFRRTVLNALMWINRLEVPAGGAASTVSPEELGANLDKK